jgi:peptidoglycan/xylan/chitin deacetylase (PgdA/CDA1 family)
VAFQHRGMHLLIAGCLLLVPERCVAQKVAITFDDLPQNGILPSGVTRQDITGSALAILAQEHVPPVFGFINAGKLEGDIDGAEALKLWAAAEPVGSHTYSHIELHQNTVDAFERDVELNEPVLELLSPNGSWRWLRYPYLREGETVAKRRAVRDYLKRRGYRIAQVTIDWEDYLWNSPYARCVDKKDAKSIEWLRTSYLSTASMFIDVSREMARLVYGRDIDHVVLLHLGAFTATILRSTLDLLRNKGLSLVTLEEAQRDLAYASDPDIGSAHGGTLLEQLMDARKLTYPAVGKKPYKELREICQ